MTAATVPTMTLDDDTARELSRAAKQAETWLQRRDRLIVEALAKGGGVREVARLVGLTHPSVLNILKREAKGGTSDAPGA